MGDTRIVVDAMGGDYAPEWIIRGAVEAVNEGAKAHIILTGKEAVINGELAKYTYDTSKIEIKNCTEENTCHRCTCSGNQKQERLITYSWNEYGKKWRG